MEKRIRSLQTLLTILLCLQKIAKCFVFAGWLTTVANLDTPLLMGTEVLCTALVVVVILSFMITETKKVLKAAVHVMQNEVVGI